MGVRTPQFNAAVSSRARSVQSYYPYYPPPVYPEESDVRGGFSGFGNLPLSYTDSRTNKGLVHSKWNRWGDRTRYTIGGVIQRVFHMKATGQVESSMSQPILNMPLSAQGNDYLYRAAKGYPRNLGLSEKVPTLPNEALNGTNAGTMQPRPQITRNIFVRRNYTAAPSVPAQPQGS